mmetsp:Transcript_24744/g.67946  ORF Transcript_24744/g.67946 Transcript_24744/m.67946 type:complete len:200 (-) Transcript_24744:327-926(-)
MHTAQGSDGSPGRAPSKGECGGQGGKSERYHMTVKHTFLHASLPVAETPAGWELLRGSLSDPEPSTSDSLCSPGASCTYKIDLYDQIVFGDNDGQTRGLMEEDDDDENGDQVDLGASVEGHDEAPRQRRRNARPCKSARLRYAKLAARLERKITNDPEGFDVGKANFPTFVRNNPKLTVKLTERLMGNRAAELQKRAQA